MNFIAAKKISKYGLFACSKLNFLLIGMSHSQIVLNIEASDHRFIIYTQLFVKNTKMRHLEHTTACLIYGQSLPEIFGTQKAPFSGSGWPCPTKFNFLKFSPDVAMHKSFNWQKFHHGVWASFRDTIFWLFSDIRKISFRLHFCTSIAQLILLLTGCRFHYCS